MEISTPVLFLKGSYHIWAWLPFWSYDQNIANKISMLLPKDWPSGFREDLEIVDDDGRTPDHGHPISSPCEPLAHVS